MNPSIDENALKQEIADEASGASRYQDMATKLTHLKEPHYADILRLLSDAEMMHRVILLSMVDTIEVKCGK